MITDRDTTIGYHCPFCGMSILNRINVFSMNGNLIKLKCVCGSSELVAQMLKDNKFRLTVPCILCPNSHSYTLSSGTFFKKELFSFTCKFTAINICFIGKDNKVYEALKKNEDELMQIFAAYEEEYGEVMENPDEDSDGFDDYDYFDDFDDGDYYLEDLNEFDEFGDDLDFDDYGQDEKHPGFVLHKNKDFIPKADNSDNSDNSDDSDDSVSFENIDDINNIKVSSYQIVSRILDNISVLYNKNKIVCNCGNLDGTITILDNAVRIECKNCGSYRNIKSTSVSDSEYLNDLDALYLDDDD